MKRRYMLWTCDIEGCTSTAEMSGSSADDFPSYWTGVRVSRISDDQPSKFFHVCTQCTQKLRRMGLKQEHG